MLPEMVKQTSTDVGSACAGSLLPLDDGELVALGVQLAQVWDLTSDVSLGNQRDAGVVAAFDGCYREVDRARQPVGYVACAMSLPSDFEGGK